VTQKWKEALVAGNALALHLRAAPQGDARSAMPRGKAVVFRPFKFSTGGSPPQIAKFKNARLPRLR
jgi:hypothetical protein